MAPELSDEHHVELIDDARHVGGAWLLAAVLVTFLMTVIAPLLTA